MDIITRLEPFKVLNVNTVSIGPSSARIQIGHKPNNVNFDRVDIILNDMGREVEIISKNEFILENLKEDYEYELKVIPLKAYTVLLIY